MPEATVQYSLDEITDLVIDDFRKRYGFAVSAENAHVNLIGEFSIDVYLPGDIRINKGKAK